MSKSAKFGKIAIHYNLLQNSWNGVTVHLILSEPSAIAILERLGISANLPDNNPEW